MDTKKPLIIGYSGSLAYYDPAAPQYSNSFLRDWFWTYNHLSSDPSTRSPFFLFLAIQILNKEFSVDASKLKLRLWGSIDKRNILQAKQMGIEEMLEIDDYVPKEKSLERLRECDLLFLPLESSTAKGNPLFIPGKLFEYMQIGKPVLSLSGPSDCADILHNSGLGIILDSHDTKAVIQCLNSFINNPDLLRSYSPNYSYISQYSFKNLTSQLTTVFDELLKQKT